MKIALYVLAATLVLGSNPASSQWRNFDSMLGPRAVDPVEEGLLAHEPVSITNGVVCATQGDVEDLLWRDTKSTEAVRKKKIAEGKCVIAPRGATVRLEGMVGWGRSSGTFYCELKVDLLAQTGRPDPRFGYTMKGTFSPFFLNRCRRFSLI